MGDRWRYDLQFDPRQIKLIEEQLFHSINIYIYIYIYIYILIYTHLYKIYTHIAIKEEFVILCFIKWKHII